MYVLIIHTMESILNNLSITLVLLVIIFRIAAFENQRWVRYRKSGRQGQSQVIGAFVDLAMPLAGILWGLFLIAFFVDTSFLTALTIYLITFVALVLWGLISRDNIFVWTLSTVAVLPMGIYLLGKTSLFGLIN